jgi:hypothetical protein
MKTTLRLEITTSFNRTLTPAEMAQAKHRLTEAANHLAGEGLLTGDGPALDSWESHVLEIKSTKRSEPRHKRTRA